MCVETKKTGRETRETKERGKKPFRGKKKMSDDNDLWTGWRNLDVAPCELRLKMTLDNGQCFEWYRITPHDAITTTTIELEYAGVLGARLIGLRQTATSVWYKQHWPVPDNGANGLESLAIDALVRDYLSLPHTCPRTQQPMHTEKVLQQLYVEWSKTATSHFKQLVRVFPGVRLLRQDPLTTLFSFIASSNNNVPRIRQMVHALRKALGVRIAVPDEYTNKHLVMFGDQKQQTSEWYTFPTLAALGGASEERLRKLGFGYRAPYVVRTAKMVSDKGGATWLASLRAMTREQVETHLVALHGVGPKVAACTALFSLDKLDALPVDTHVWQIALRDYAAESRSRAGVDLHKIKSLTPATMRHVGNLFRALFGPLTGWAQCLLFLAELPAFKCQLVPTPAKRKIASTTNHSRKKTKKTA